MYHLENLITKMMVFNMISSRIRILLILKVYTLHKDQILIIFHHSNSRMLIEWLMRSKIKILKEMSIQQKTEVKNSKETTSKKMKNFYIQTYIDKEVIKTRVAIPKMNLKIIKGITNSTPRIRKNPLLLKVQNLKIRKLFLVKIKLMSSMTNSVAHLTKKQKIFYRLEGIKILSQQVFLMLITGTIFIMVSHHLIKCKTLTKQNYMVTMLT